MRLKFHGFTEKLNEEMKRRNISPGMLAIKTGVSERMIRRYQRGVQPGVQSAKAIADGLGLKLDYMIGYGTVDKEEES